MRSAAAFSCSSLLVSSANRLPSVTTGSTSVMKVIHGGDMAYEARKGLF